MRVKSTSVDKICTYMKIRDSQTHHGHHFARGNSISPDNNIPVPLINGVLPGGVAITDIPLKHTRGLLSAL